MRLFAMLLLAISVSACASSLERQAGSAARDDCWQQAEAYIRANMASIANEWREHEKYKHYQQCLAKQANAAS